MRWSSLQQNPSLIQRRWRLCRLKSKRIAPRIKWSNINLERIQICILVIAIIRFVCDCVFVVYSLIIVLYSKPHICFVQIDDYTFNALKQLFFCSISIIHTLFISITISDAILLYSSTKSTFIIFFCDYFDIPRKIFKRIIKVLCWFSISLLCLLIQMSSLPSLPQASVMKVVKKNLPENVSV